MYARAILKTVLLITVTSCAALVLLTSPQTALADGPVIYVDVDASTGGDGQGWDTAYKYLQDALDYTEVYSNTDYQIWVAEGIYYPDEDEDGDHASDAVTETFRLRHSNVQLYGGFAGTETVRDQRDWGQHLTVLSGDVDGNDDATGIVGENAYHVLYLDGDSYESITEATVIDGFAITAGQARNYPDDAGGGMYCDGSCNYTACRCDPTLANLLFSGNWADRSGGAIYNDAHYGGAANPALTNVAFIGNAAAGSGGAMYNNGWNLGNSNPILTHVTFRGNAAGEDGGAMCNNGRGDVQDVHTGTSSPTLINVLFSGNYAVEKGGAIYNNGYYGHASSTLTNVTIAGNWADQGAGMYNEGTYGSSHPSLTTVIMWRDAIYNENATPVISYSDIWGSGSGTPGNVNADPQFVAPLAASKAPTTGGDYRLRSTSPVIDAGDNSAVPADLTTDLDGNPRFVDAPIVSDTGNGTPPIVDMGAYEVQRVPKLRLSKRVTPTFGVDLQGTLTYTLVLRNLGVLSDTGVQLTDPLPEQVDFDEWIAQPAGAAVAGDAITWAGSIGAMEAITLALRVTYTCADYEDIFTNTVQFTGTLQSGQASVGFGVEPPVLYVDADASGAATGLSWTNAYTKLQDALARTHAHAHLDYEIWVAQGVYYPDEGGGHTDNDDDASFRLSYNTMQLYGGFESGEQERDARDPEANVTVLSGDIDGNDTSDIHGVVTTTDHITGNNAIHVLVLDGETHEAITGKTAIDGFVITAGQADDVAYDFGGGLWCYGAGSGHACNPTLANLVFSGNLADDDGGGIFNDGDGGEASPALTNVLFCGNRAGHGSAMYNDGEDGGQSNPVLTHVTFSGNTAKYSGGAVYNWGISGDSSPVLTDVLFINNAAENGDGGAVFNNGSQGNSSPFLTRVRLMGNVASENGGALFNRSFDGTSNPTLTNVLFSGNRAGEDGGALFNDGRYSGESSPMLTNVTFSGNRAMRGGAMYNDGSESGTSSPVLTNLILWGNTAITGTQVYNAAAHPTIGYSLVEGGLGGSGIYNQDSSVSDNGGNIASDPHFTTPITASAAPTTTGDYHLQISSPAIDAGENSAIPAGVTTDLDGKLRFVDVPTTTDTGNGTPPIVDMGAYEVQAGPGLVGIPELLHPPHGTVTTSHTVTLSWQAGDGAPPDGYNVRLDGKVITTTGTTSSTVLPLGIHTWTARAYNVAGYSAWASLWRVEVTETLPTLPGTPVLLRPPNGTITTSHAITLRWQAGSGPTPSGYNVRLDGDLITTTEITSPTVLGLGTHAWTVRGYNTEGHSPWAIERRLTVAEEIHSIYLPLILRKE
jgi:uncharacterized repeat protein (TIGR01451 family)